MKTKNESQFVLRDLVALAGLYRNVAWMFGQRMRRGSDWQAQLFDEAVQRGEFSPDPESEREAALTR